MKSTDAPTKTTVPFASSAGSNYIRTVPVPSQIGTTDGAASYTDGFPPDTFVNEAAGGYPPNGRDINYLLNVISAWDRWVAAGGSPVYDSTFSSAIGGYPNGAVLRMSDGGGFWISTVDDNTSDPDSGGANWSVLALSQTKLDARYVISDADGSGLNKITVSGNITLTQADSGKFIDPWNAPAGTVITLPFSGTAVPSGWNVTIGPNQNPLTIKNDTTGNVISPDGGPLISQGGGTWSKPTGAGAPLYLHEYAYSLLAITTGRTIIADAVNNNEAVALGQGDGRFVISDADGSGLNKITVSGNITLTQADSGKFIDPWSAPAGTVITLPFSGTAVPSGWNVTIGPNQNPLTIKNDTTGYVLSPDGGRLIAYGGGTWSKPTGAGAPLYLHEYAHSLLAITTGRTIIADAVNNNEAVALGQGDGRYAFSNTVQNLTSSRALGTTYTNSAGHPIWINVRTNNVGGGIGLGAVINGVAWHGSNMYSSSGAENAVVSAPVPPGATYKVNSSDTLGSWVEYR